MALNLPPPPPLQFLQPGDQSKVNWNWHDWFYRLQTLAGHLDTINVPASIMTVVLSGTTNNVATISLIAQTANTVWAGPTSGAPAQPTFRALTIADLPITFTNWPSVKRTVDVSETCIVNANFQLTLHVSFNVSGIVNNSGEIWIENTNSDGVGSLIFNSPENSAEIILL